MMNIYTRRIVLSLLCVFLINIAFSQDTEAPVIISAARDTSYECGVTTNLSDKLTTWFNNAGGAVFSDNSGSFTIVTNITLAQAITIFNNSLDVLCGNKQKVDVTFSAIDAAGNTSATTTASFFTTDITPPTINSVPSAQYDCKVGIRDTLIAWIKKKAGYVAADNCSNTLIWNNFTYAISSQGVDIASGGGNIALGPYPMIPDGICQWKLRINFFVKDECSNQTITPGTTTFSVTDNVAPVFVQMPADVTVDCSNIPPEDPPQVLDYCDKKVIPVLEVQTTRSPDTLSCMHYNYVITRIWTATDKCGNSSTHTHKITVIDTFPPTVIDKPTVSISCDTYQNSPDSIYIKYSDNCSTVFASFKDTVKIESCVSIVDRTYTLTDVCGNKSTYKQVLQIKQDKTPLIIKKAVDEVFSCSDQVDFNARLFLWAQSMGHSTANPICGPISSFAALKGSYILQDTSTWPGISPNKLPSQVCPSPLAGFLRYAEVDFVYFDTCGNAAVTSAVFGVTDTLAPILTNCGENLTLFTVPTNCTAEIKIKVPDAQDDCVESSPTIHKIISAAITSSTPPGPESIIDAVDLHIGPFNPSTALPLSDGLLEVRLVNMDIDDVTEYFNIFDEDGNMLGTTAVGAGQCATTEMTIFLPINKIESWISDDGYIDLKFVPNMVAGSPVLSINNICGGSKIEVSITYETDISNAVKKSYSIDGGPLILLTGQDSVDLRLGTGIHTITFFAEDCATNKSSCAIQVDVKDKTSPIIACPSKISTVLSKGVCIDTIPIPINFQVTEYCAGNRTYNQISPASNEAGGISFALNANTNLYEARNKQIVFSNVFPIRFVTNPVYLEIQFFGDNNEAGEYFEILGPGGYVIGNTAIQSDNGSCSALSVTRFEIPFQVFNTWIANKTVTILAVPKNGNDGINPCKPLANGQTIDNTSYIKGILRYSDHSFTISSSGATVFANQNIPNDIVTHPIVLNGGTNILTLTTTDLAGNTGTCTFEVEVLDLEAPIAKCKNAVVNLEPTGLVNIAITPEMINNGSQDNCQITAMKTIPSEVNCSQANTDIEVQLIVEDKHGNADTCISLVKLKPYEIKPTYTSGLCSNDTLKLFANLPTASIPGTYSFRWDGPGNIEFFTENPKIPNADESYNGVYVLTVFGFNGCVSMGSVSVNIKPLTNPVLVASEKEICLGSEVLLTTTNYSGGIFYDWYEGISPDGILLKSTPTPEVVLKPSTLDAHFYYVIARGPDCSSNPSQLLKITVLDVPLASVKDLLLSPCEGDNIVLGSATNNPKFTYTWTGPNGYQSQGANPNVVNNAGSSNAGNYFLVVNNGKCISDTAMTRVAILERPAMPIIAGAEIFCEGVVFSLVATASPTAEKFEWYLNGVLFTTTNDNSLILSNAQSTLQGNWTVKAIKGNCTSPLSLPKYVSIDLSLQVGIFNSGPVCIGDSVILEATYVPNAQYKWSGPVANIPSVFNPTIIGVPGDYSVTITTVTGCKNNASTTVKVISVPEITALSNDARPCMSAQDIITFQPSVFPDSSHYSYKWTGPNGYISNDRNATISNINLQDTGIYSLVVYNHNCPSPPFTSGVDFDLIPAKPALSAAPFYCVGDTIKIIGSQASSGNYIWNTPLGQITTTSPILSYNTASMAQSGKYTLEVKSGNCTSQPSDPINIEVRPKPSTEIITSNSPVCFGDTLQLNAGQQPNAKYLWTGSTTITSQNPSIILPNADKSLSGTYQVQILVNGCYSDLSEKVSVLIKDEITTPAFAEKTISICSTDISGLEICLQPLTLHPNATYSLIDASGKVIIPVGTQPCFLLTDISGFKEGANLLYAKTAFDGCTSETSESLVLVINTPPAIKASAMENEIVACPEDIVRLTSLHGPPLVELTWTTLNDEVLISDPKSISPSITRLESGDNVFYLDYSVTGCPNFSRDTVNVYVQFEPQAINDEYVMNYGDVGNFEILNNDLTPDLVNISILNGPQHGTAKIEGTNIIYIPDPRYPVDQVITYRICADYCMDLCDEASVTIKFNKDILCKAPSIITPNGDGINDYFVIPCLETGQFPDNKVVIFNEWGEEVFYGTSYKNDWNGTYGGNDLPVGTYFYIIDVGKGQEVINGFLIIQR